MNKRLLVVALFFLIGCSRTNVDYLKEHATDTWRQAGYEIVGYERYQTGGTCGGSYGGGYVWYTLRRIPDNEIMYHGALQRWGDEIHIYNLTAIDGTRPWQ
jgi:hypothetical protein